MNEREYDPQERTPRRPDACLLPTLLERLQDDDPGQRSESDSAAMVTRARMREIVRDALMDLFNTTNLEKEIPARYTDALSSVVNYGLPPLAGQYIGELSWPEMERMIRRAVVRFEPRIIPDSLRIEPPQLGTSSGTGTDRHAGNTVRFTIHAMIHMDPYPLSFTLVNDVDLETNNVEATLAKA